MQKTVNVIDEAGNRYEATYVKRARGLVKSGRARFIDDDTICLACPPNDNKFSEDNSMTNNDNIITNAVVDTETGEVTMSTTANQSYTYEYFIEQIARLSAEYSAASTMAIVKDIVNIDSEATPCGGSGDEIAKAAADAVRCRETTVQQMLTFYTKMAEELAPRTNTTSNEKKMFLDWVATCIQNTRAGTETPDYAKLWNEIK